MVEPPFRNNKPAHTAALGARPVAGFATGSPRASLNVLLSERPALPAAQSLHMDREFSCRRQEQAGAFNPTCAPMTASPEPDSLRLDLYSESL